jgi:MHS family proline/betaine transporter-like MFS transporter
MIKKRKPIFAAMIGNALEYYDVTLYGFFTVILSPLFFPASDPATSRIAALFALSAGILMRPIGGLIFGYLGDRFGRRKALMLAIFLVTIPTVTMGILPTYDKIGIYAPIIIILCRLLQGLCTAGEYSGASILIAEYSPHNQRGFACSLLPSSSLSGAVLGTALGALFTLEIMPPWAWRIPFLLGGVFGLIGLYLRRTIEESPDFKKIEAQHKLVKVPLLEILKTHRRSFLCSMGIGSSILVLFYMNTVHINHMMLNANLGVTHSQSMIINTVMMLLLISLFPIMGYMADRIGVARFMKIASLTTIAVALPIFWLISSDASLVKFIFAQIIFNICGAGFVGPSGAFLAGLFPVEERYTGVAVSAGIGEAVFGGTTPLASAILVSWTHSEIAPAFYLMFCSFLGWLALYVVRTQEKSSNFKDFKTKSCAAIG